MLSGLSYEEEVESIAPLVILFPHDSVAYTSNPGAQIALPVTYGNISYTVIVVGDDDECHNINKGGASYE